MSDALGSAPRPPLAQGDLASLTTGDANGKVDPQLLTKVQDYAKSTLDPQKASFVLAVTCDPAQVNKEFLQDLLGQVVWSLKPENPAANELLGAMDKSSIDEQRKQYDEINQTVHTHFKEKAKSSTKQAKAAKKKAKECEGSWTTFKSTKIAAHKKAALSNVEAFKAKARLGNIDTSFVKTALQNMLNLPYSDCFGPTCRLANILTNHDKTVRNLSGDIKQHVARTLQHALSMRKEPLNERELAAVQRTMNCFGIQSPELERLAQAQKALFDQVNQHKAQAADCLARKDYVNAVAALGDMSKTLEEAIGANPHSQRVASYIAKIDDAQATLDSRAASTSKKADAEITLANIQAELNGQIVDYHFLWPQ